MHKVFIILYDMMGTKALSNSSKMTKLANIIRHYKVSIIMTTQKYSGIPRTVRLQARVVSLFRPNNMNEMDYIIEEHSDKSNKKKFLLTLQDVFKEPYGFMHIDYTCHDMNMRYRQGFDIFLNLFN